MDTPVIRKRKVCSRIEYNVQDMYDTIKPTLSLDDIYARMIANDYIGARLEYMSAGCAKDFIKESQVKCPDSLSFLW